MISTIGSLPRGCQADPQCRHVPYFEARVVTSQAKPTRSACRKLCAIHLGEVVNDLAKWARRQGITDGRVAVFIAEPPPCDRQSGGGDFPFGSIPIGR